MFFGVLNKYLKCYYQYVLDNFGFRMNYDRRQWISNAEGQKPGGFYTWHHDGQFRGPGDGRLLTYLWYLNTCEKGNTEFSCGESVEPKTR